MRLVTFSTADAPEPGPGVLRPGGTIVDLSGTWTTTLELLRGGEEALALAAEFDGAGIPVADVTAWQPPLTPPRIFGIGLNYRSHAEEQGVKIPRSPIVFTKALSSLVGHGAAIVQPAATQQLDYEAELAVVIGRRAVNVEVQDAMDHVVGYTCLNDVTARDIQRWDRQWFRSKSFPTFTPMGRELVTVDEAPALESLRVTGTVAGELRQDAPVTDLIFGVSELISFLSSFTTLEPGDVIATGTPSGVGFVFDPPRFLAPGDTVQVAIPGVSQLENTVVAA